MRTLVSAAIAATLLATATPPSLRAQEGEVVAGSQPGWSVDHTMRRFALDLGGEVRGYFPTRGEWTWMVTTHYRGAPDRVGVWRFPVAQTDSAIESGGPLCDSFHSGDSAMLGTLIAPGVDMRGSDGWRRVRGTRFVPNGAAGPEVFVEWRREDGRWVISSFGGEGWYAPPLLGRAQARGEVVRDALRSPLRLPIADTEPTAAGAAWFTGHQPIVVAGHRLNPYGLPRLLGPGDVVRYGSLDGVGVYVEPRASRDPEVVYVVVNRAGEFQPYQNMTGNGCEH